MNIPRYDPLIISNYFLEKSIQSTGDVTPMKLIKLVYLSHGWYLGYNNEPLISEAVLAWQYGPVIVSVYEEFKRFGKNQISRLADINKDGVLKSTEYKPTNPHIQKFLDLIWNTYKDYDGLQLSTLTHKPGSPWHTIIHSNGKGAIIPNDVIKEYYQTLIKNNERAAQRSAQG